MVFLFSVLCMSTLVHFHQKWIIAIVYWVECMATTRRNSNAFKMLLLGIIFCQSKYCHITPLLKELHWLQITERIDYKITVIVYCCRKGLAPNYLSTMIVKSHNRPLRSTTNNKLPVNKFNTAFVNNRSFKALRPRIWNNLPDGLRNIEDINIFKAKLKTFLFRRSYT